MSDSTKPPFTFTTNFNTRTESTGGGAREQTQEPFCVAILGNFSARPNSSESSKIGERHFIEVDRYNADSVFASMTLSLTLNLNDDSNNQVRVALSSLRDFHPDKLYLNVDTFSDLRDLRRRLKNNATFKAAATELGAFDKVEDTTPADEPNKVEDMPSARVELTPEEDSGISLLDSILDATEGSANDTSNKKEIASPTPAPTPVSKSMVGGFIQQLFADKQKIRARDPRQDEMVATVDEAITLQMRSILHHPEFQALESIWRALDFLVKRIPKDTSIKLYLLDVSQEELATDLDIRDVTQSQLYRLFGDTSMGDINWNLIVSDYCFSPDIDDILMLSQLGFIAQHIGAQFMAAANEKFVGCANFAEAIDADKWITPIDSSVEQAWSTLRKSEVAKNLCLALPRFIVREPYGNLSSSIKSFAFEEMLSPPQHQDYLWGNPAFLKAEQILRAFMNSGWQMQYSSVFKTEDLPLHYYQHKGRTLIKPCAEIPLSDKGALKISEQGLIPLWSVKDTDKIHSSGFHSISE